MRLNKLARRGESAGHAPAVFSAAEWGRRPLVTRP